MLLRMRASICGWLDESSAIRASAQPKRAAPSSIAAAIAVVPLVIPAYDILTPEAAPIGPSIARRSMLQWRNDLANPDRGLWADGIAIDIDRLAVERCQGRCQAPGKRLRLARRQDRQKEIGAGEKLVFVC